MRVLVVAPHPDDEVLGAGGTIAKRARGGDDVYVCIATKGYEPIHPANVIEAGRKEAEVAHRLLGVRETFFLDFPATSLDTIPQYKINGGISELVRSLCIEEVYTPFIGDIHKDHRIVADAVMVAVRPKFERNVRRVYAYETISETGWNIPGLHNAFDPNVFEDISDYVDLKVRALETYKSQVEPYPAARSSRAAKSLAEYRGTTVGLRAAEAFTLIREIR